MAIAVRKARPDDFDAFVALAEQFFPESSVDYPALDREWVAKVWDVAFKDKETMSVFVTEANGSMTGFLVGVITRSLFSPEPFARHANFYVGRAHRGGRSAFLLVRAFLDWARERGVRRAIISSDALINEAAVGRFYEKMGFRRIGAQFMAEV